MNRTPTDDEWLGIDEDLFANRKINAIKRIMNCDGCSLREAVELATGRVEKLKVESPDRFQCDLITYWETFNVSWDDRGDDF